MRVRRRFLFRMKRAALFAVLASTACGGRELNNPVELTLTNRTGRFVTGVLIRFDRPVERVDRLGRARFGSARLRTAAPDKHLIGAPVEEGQGCQACSECPHMKLNTLEKIYLALRDLEPRIELDEELRQRAAKPLLRMLELS